MRPLLRLYQAQRERDLAVVEQLLREYLSWTTENFSALHGLPVEIDQMMAHSLADLDLFFPPKGALLIAADEQPLGIGFLKPIRSDTCELKRMYVRPEARGLGLGKQLLTALLDQARSIGYRAAVLDSGEFMLQAHALYRSVGFTEIERYPESEMATELDSYLVYMRLELD